MSCAQAGMIALDARVVIPFGRACHVWEGSEPKSQSVTLESKTRYTTRSDDRVFDHDLSPQNGGVNGTKSKSGVDVKLLGKDLSTDASGRLQWDMGVGVVAGGEISANAGNFEITGKLDGGCNLRSKKVGSRVEFTLQAYGHGEVTILLKIPQAANMIQFPVRVTVDGTRQRTWSFDVDQIRALKGI